MRQIIIEEGKTWVEHLPRGVRLLNDTPGETGLSPYEICFGRQRSLAHFPITVEKPSEDAQIFFDRMRQTDVEISRKIQDIQEKRAQTTNKHRIDHPALEEGSKVWYKPEVQPGHDKTDTYWKGPGIVLHRIGKHSYVIKIKEGTETEAHRSQLRPHIEDTQATKPYPLYYFSGAAPEVAATDEWTVEEIQGHRNDQAEGLKFLVKWQEFGEEKNTWEQALSFVTPNEIFMKYCRDKAVEVDLLGQWEAQRPKPTQL
jgi:hypothetical protein